MTDDDNALPAAALCQQQQQFVLANFHSK